MSDSEGRYLLEQARAEQAMFNDYCAQQEESWSESFMPITWTTNKGHTLFIKDMSTDHILNCIKWVTTNHAGLRMVIMVTAFVNELKRRKL